VKEWREREQRKRRVGREGRRERKKAKVGLCPLAKIPEGFGKNVCFSNCFNRVDYYVIVLEQM